MILQWLTLILVGNRGLVFEARTFIVAPLKLGMWVASLSHMERQSDPCLTVAPSPEKMREKVVRLWLE